ncbi:ATP-dependent RNA helicase, partial [bacterium]|nr:ATP-dependent RNA helicase [bacterium]
MANKMLGFWKKENDVVTLAREGKGIIVMPTGTGKTTQCPQLLVQNGFADLGQIWVSVPRRVLAIELARRVAEEMGTRLGDKVGYQIRGEDAQCKDTSVLFLTEGMLRAKIQANPSLDGVSMVLFDEFHTRSLMGDFNVALIERAQEEGSKVGFLLMSATIDAGYLAEHFGCGVVDGSTLGTQFPIEERYLDYDSRDLVEAAVEEIRRLVSGRGGNGLVFMPGKAEISAVVNALQREKLPNVTILPLHGGLDGDDRSAPFRQRSGITVTVATDIVETGATLPDITWVVDSGLAREVRYDVISDIGGLRLAEVAKDRLKQRRGRCGRVQAGVYVGLFTEFNKNARQAQTTPEIFRKPLREVILTIKSIGLSREGEPIRLLDSPPKANWKQAKAQLQALGFVA